MPVRPAGITDLSCTEINNLVISMNEPPYRADQIRKWIYQNLAISYEEMTDLPLELRRKLAQKIPAHTLEIMQQVTGGNDTVKALFKCADGKTLESALMYYRADGNKERRTVCISTQAGCSIGCPFCATGQQGFEHNLTPGEITDQVLYFARTIPIRHQETKNKLKAAGHISNIVFMGMGEPLANYENLWQAIETLNSPDCFGLGARNMTISTSGLVPQIKRMSREKLQVGLAVSLHAADNDLRNRLVPINRKYPLEELIPVCREYSRITGRRVSFEYILFSGINDSIAQARELAGLIRGLKCHVNLIPANYTDNAVFQPPPKRVVLAFENELKRERINVTLRESRGQDIDAGCGQLRGRYLKETVKQPENMKRLEKVRHGK